MVILNTNAEDVSIHAVSPLSIFAGAGGAGAALDAGVVGAATRGVTGVSCARVSVGMVTRRKRELRKPATNLCVESRQTSINLCAISEQIFGMGAVLVLCSNGYASGLWSRTYCFIRRLEKLCPVVIASVCL